MLKDCIRCGESKEINGFHNGYNICKTCVQARKIANETFYSEKNTKYAFQLIKNLVMAHRKKSKLEFECSFKDMQKFIQPMLEQ